MAKTWKSPGIHQQEITAQSCKGKYSIFTKWSTSQQYKTVHYDKCNNLDETQNMLSVRSFTQKRAYILCDYIYMML